MISEMEFKFLNKPLLLCWPSDYVVVMTNLTYQRVTISQPHNCEENACTGKLTGRHYQTKYDRNPCNFLKIPTWVEFPSHVEHVFPKHEEPGDKS